MSEIPVIRRIMFLAAVTTGLTLWFESPAVAVNATDLCFVETGMDDSSAKLRKRLADWTAEDPEGTIAVWTGTKVEHASDPVTIGWAIDWFVTQPLCTLIVVNTKPPRLPIFVVHADNPDGASQTALLVAGMSGFKNLVVYVYGVDRVGPDRLPQLKKETQELLLEYDFPGNEIRFEECLPHCRGEPFRTQY